MLDQGDLKLMPLASPSMWEMGDLTLNPLNPREFPEMKLLYHFGCRPIVGVGPVRSVE